MCPAHLKLVSTELLRPAIQATKASGNPFKYHGKNDFLERAHYRYFSIIFLDYSIESIRHAPSSFIT